MTTLENIDECINEKEFKKLLVDKDLNVAEVAQRMNKSIPAVYALIKRPKSKWTIQDVEAFKKALDLNLEEFSLIF